jgi:hypothetical protein
MQSKTPFFPIWIAPLSVLVYVPKGTLDAYKKADFWKNFQTIIEE